jgi:hypothetical protein
MAIDPRCEWRLPRLLNPKDAAQISRAMPMMRFPRGPLSGTGLSRANFTSLKSKSSPPPWRCDNSFLAITNACSTPVVDVPNARYLAKAWRKTSSGWPRRGLDSAMVHASALLHLISVKYFRAMPMWSWNWSYNVNQSQPKVVAILCNRLSNVELAA